VDCVVVGSASDQSRTQLPGPRENAALAPLVYTFSGNNTWGPFTVPRVTLLLMYGGQSIGAGGGGGVEQGLDDGAGDETQAEAQDAADACRVSAQAVSSTHWTAEWLAVCMIA
jgi:hypothetical protein